MTIWTRAVQLLLGGTPPPAYNPPYPDTLYNVNEFFGPSVRSKRRRRLFFITLRG